MPCDPESTVHIMAGAATVTQGTWALYQLSHSDLCLGNSSRGCPLGSPEEETCRSLESHLWPTGGFRSENKLLKKNQTNTNKTPYFPELITWTADKCVGRKCVWDGCQDCSLAGHREGLLGGGAQSVRGGGSVPANKRKRSSGQPAMDQTPTRGGASSWRSPVVFEVTGGGLGNQERQRPWWKVKVSGSRSLSCGH